MLLLGYLLLALVVAALLFYAVVALLPNGLSLTPQRDQRPFELPPDRRLVRADMDKVQLPISLRGYRFLETDDLIDRLTAEIVVRDEEIARLRGQGGRADRADRSLEFDRPAAEPRTMAEPRATTSEPEHGRRDV